MANYLKRVIAAGARVRSTARPSIQTAAIVPSIPVTSFPLPSSPSVNEVPPPLYQSSASSPQPGFAAPPEPSEEIATGGFATHVQRGDATGTAASATKEPPERGAQVPVPLSVAIARMTSRTRVVAPKELRAQPLAPLMSKTSSIEVTNMITAVGGHVRGSGSSARGEADTSSTATASPAPAAVRQVVKTAPASDIRGAPTIAPPGTEVVTKSASTPGALLTAPHEPSSDDQELEFFVKNVGTESESKVRSGGTQSFREVSSLGGKPRPVPEDVVKTRTPADSFPTASVLLQTEPKSGERPTEANEPSESQVLGIKPKMVRAVATPPIGVLERSASNRGRITIGRLDVQVNNRQRVPPNIAPQRAPVVAPRSGYIEALYLERLALRP
jgi:hypothetical protein